MLSVEAMIEAQKHIHGGVAPSGGGVVGGNRELHVSNYARGMLDLRLQISRLRIEYLNQMNTQSTLLAGCGVAMLNSGELTNLDDKAEWDDYSILSYAWIKFFNYLYSASAAVCLAASCWTIYTAMNLITLSIHSTLNGDSVVAITEADQLIETRMAEVRLVFVIALVSLLTATLLIVGALADTAILLICAVIFGFTCWHAVKSDSGTVRVYERYTGLTIQDRWLGASSGGIEQLKELLIPYGMDDARTGRERLHDRADPVIERLMKKMLVGDIMEGIFKKAARGRDLGKASKLSDEECAIALQRFWRRKSAILNQQRGKHVVRTGWLLKTPSGAGPLERLKAMCVEAADGSKRGATRTKPGGNPLKLVDVPTGPAPKFARWFVLDATAHTLAIYTGPEDPRAHREPKGRIDDLRTYALAKVVGEDGIISLALLPRTLQGAGDSPSFAPAAAKAKSWYVRGPSESITRDWAHWIRKAGAARVIDTEQQWTLRPESWFGESPDRLFSAPEVGGKATNSSDTLPRPTISQWPPPSPQPRPSASQPSLSRAPPLDTALAAATASTDQLLFSPTDQHRPTNFSSRLLSISRPWDRSVKPAVAKKSPGGSKAEQIYVQAAAREAARLASQNTAATKVASIERGRQDRQMVKELRKASADAALGGVAAAEAAVVREPIAEATFDDRIGEGFATPRIHHVDQQQWWESPIASSQRQLRPDPTPRDLLLPLGRI